MRVIKKHGQIWIETVIYTLIGLTIIGLVLAAALPKINEKKDEVVIEQSIVALGIINDKIYEVLRAPGNRRVVDLEISNGALIIDIDKNTIAWIIDSSLQYSELDTSISLGRINVTTKTGNPWKVELKSKYNMDIRYNDDISGIKRLDVAPTPYRLIIENAGIENNNIVIKLSVA